MTHDEIIERMKAVKKAHGWSNLDIEIRANSMVSQSVIANCLRGESIRLYTFLDILDAMGLEINII